MMKQRKRERIASVSLQLIYNEKNPRGEWTKADICPNYLYPWVLPAYFPLPRREKIVDEISSMQKAMVYFVAG